MSDKELIQILKERFKKNIHYHKDMNWNDIEKRLTASALKSLKYMEETGGEPDVIKYDKDRDKYLYVDTSIESPMQRRSLCYDGNALNSRKTNKPQSSVIDECEKNNIKLLTEEEYMFLQTLDNFDLKSSSWLYTPNEIRKLGGALFGDKKYNRTFIYHNGAESYYSSRGFRGCIYI